ncbi:ABC transporter substrate-binding protein [Pseudonocardia sediminis]|nr:ABC transporter substrate-binding protein [Pseudonocardia sediminis]
MITVVALASACGAPSPSRPPDPDPADWSAVQTAARGQTLNFYLYGGDDAVNRFVSGYVAPRLAEQGVTLNAVPVADTADALNKVLTETQAGRAEGGVDAIWINGENFATGVQAGLWYCGYPAALPNSRAVDLADPEVATDFGTPVDGCAAAWQRADSALVYDSARLAPADVASLTALEAWARANPGRFTYPAPPDFTGSMVVRTFLYDTAGGPQGVAGGPGPVADRLHARLNALEPALWRGGQTYPTSQTAVEQLFASGEISAYYTYGAGTVAQKVTDGVYPPTTREAVPDVGNIGNVSNVAIPANAPHKAAALVLANLLQDPQTQLRAYTDAGLYPAIDPARLDPATRARFAAVDRGPSVLAPEQLGARTLPELDAGTASAVDDGWIANVLQR